LRRSSTQIQKRSLEHRRRGRQHRRRQKQISWPTIGRGARRERRAALSMLAHPVTTVRKAAAVWPALHELLAEKPLPPTSLSRLVGPDRHLAVVRSGVDEVKAVAHAYDAKVNDVLLSLIAGGLRALLSSRGEPVDEVVTRIYVPVSLRHRQYAGARGNAIAQMVIPLPIGVSDPVQRLQKIAAETAMRKGLSRLSVGGMPTRGLAGKLFLKLIDRQRVNVESADIPGPDQPLYFAGARLLELFPVLPLIGKVSLGVAGMSYAGQFNITAVGDRDTYPDIDIFAEAVRDELRALSVTLDPAASFVPASRMAIAIPAHGGDDPRA
jgi:diacylglycerol O-acyltransferase / wax synthase